MLLKMGVVHQSRHTLAPFHAMPLKPKFSFQSLSWNCRGWDSKIGDATFMDASLMAKNSRRVVKHYEWSKRLENSKPCRLAVYSFSNQICCIHICVGNVSWHCVGHSSTAVGICVDWYVILRFAWRYKMQWWRALLKEGWWNVPSTKT